MATEQHRTHEMEYLLSAPTTRGPHPLLCFLHGFDEGAPAPIEAALEKHGPLRKSNPAFIRDTFIIVAPQLANQGDLWRHFHNNVREILKQVQNDHEIDPSRKYLTGFSFGGNGVIDFGIMQPQDWAALWAVDPTRIPRSEVQPPIWLSIGEVARSGKAALIRSLQLVPKRDPAADRVYVDEGLSHVRTAASAYEDVSIYQWLLARSLAK
jgi:predicted peptidase